MPAEVVLTADEEQALCHAMRALYIAVCKIELMTKLALGARDHRQCSAALSAIKDVAENARETLKEYA